MNLIKDVYASLKFKRSDQVCAEKLNISLEKYREIKKQILEIKNSLQSEIDGTIETVITQKMLKMIDEEGIKNNYISQLEDQLVYAINQQNEKVIEVKENLEEGTSEIKGIAFSEPKSPEEIIRILKIDTGKWKLSSYWNKQHKDYWLVSALVSQKTIDSKELLENTLAGFNPSYTPVTDKLINNRFNSDCAAVISLQDLHFGKEGNYDVAEQFQQAVSQIVLKAYYAHHIDKIYYVIGGDLLNMDTFSGQTTKGTPVDNDMRAQDAYSKAFDSLYWSVQFISQFCKHLHVVYMPGNHDRLSSYHMAHALSKCFKGSETISFDVKYEERKVVVYGNNFFAFEHGDVSSKNTPLVYATEFPREWGNTVFRTCYTGHWHSKKSTEYISENEVHGFTLKHLPSLSRSDYWHYHNKFTGSKRAAVCEVHDKEKGKVSEFTYNT